MIRRNSERGGGIKENGRFLHSSRIGDVERSPSILPPSMSIRYFRGARGCLDARCKSRNSAEPTGGLKKQRSRGVLPVAIQALAHPCSRAAHLVLTSSRLWQLAAFYPAAGDGFEQAFLCPCVHSSSFPLLVCRYSVGPASLFVPRVCRNLFTKGTVARNGYPDLVCGNDCAPTHTSHLGHRYAHEAYQGRIEPLQGW